MNDFVGTKFSIPNTKTALLVCYDGTRIWKCDEEILIVKDVMDHTFNLQDCQLCWILLSATAKVIPATPDDSATDDGKKFKFSFEIEHASSLPVFVQRNILHTRIDPGVFISHYDSERDWEDTDFATTYFDIFRFHGQYTYSRLSTPASPHYRLSGVKIKSKRMEEDPSLIGMIEHIQSTEQGVPSVGLTYRGRDMFRGLYETTRNRCFFSEKLLRRSSCILDPADEFIECISYGTVR